MATVDDLLRRMHRQAAGLRLTGDPRRRLEAQLRAWTTLADAALRVLESLDQGPVQRDLYRLLGVLGRAAPGTTGRADAGLESLGVTLGVLGDAIMDFPQAVAQAGQPERAKLQRSVEAALHAAARATREIARAAGASQISETLHQIADATEPAALLPPSVRMSSLERLTVSRLAPDSLDGAVGIWAVAALHIFTNYRLVTGLALQEAAATLALLSRVTADTLLDAARRHVVSDPAEARQAARVLTLAAAAWRKASTWPSSIQLGGRAEEHRSAVRVVRDAITGPPLARLTAREKVNALRAATGIAVTIGGMQAAAVTRVASSGGLWIARERPNLRPPGVERRHVKLDWEIMDPDHPAARMLVARARSAHQLLVAAADAIDRAVLPDPLPVAQSAPIALVDGRIVAKWWEAVGPASQARRPEEEDPRRAASRPIPGFRADRPPLRPL
jgi:hypothetical protein